MGKKTELAYIFFLRILKTERYIRVFRSYLKKYSLVLYQFEGGGGLSSPSADSRGGICRAP